MYDNGVRSVKLGDDAELISVRLCDAAGVILRSVRLCVMLLG